MGCPHFFDLIVALHPPKTGKLLKQIVFFENWRADRPRRMQLSGRQMSNRDAPLPLPEGGFGASSWSRRSAKALVGARVRLCGGVRPIHLLKAAPRRSLLTMNDWASTRDFSIVIKIDLSYSYFENVVALSSRECLTLIEKPGSRNENVLESVIIRTKLFTSESLWRQHTVPTVHTVNFRSALICQNLASECNLHWK